MADEHITIKARCLCNTHTFTASLPKAKLPLDASVCHCTSCRHLTGALCLVDVHWPNEEEDVSALKCYAHSPNINFYSCPTCSSQMFCKSNFAGNSLRVITGVLDNTPGLVRYHHHSFVGDTKDGGASVWLRGGPDGHVARSWKEQCGQSEELEHGWPRPSSAERQILSPEDRAHPEFTPLWCHCRGVNFSLRSGLDLASGTNKKMSTPPSADTGKYTTHMDACDSCRRALGSDLIYWAFVPVDHIHLTNKPSASDQNLQTMSDLKDAVTRKDPRLGTLAVYESSEGVARYHCSKCSATIFYTETGLPDQADIAIGVLGHAEGARAEGILAWNYTNMDHMKDTTGGWRKDLTKTVLAEVTDWVSSQ